MDLPAAITRRFSRINIFVLVFSEKRIYLARQVALPDERDYCVHHSSGRARSALLGKRWEDREAFSVDGVL